MVIITTLTIMVYSIQGLITGLSPRYPYHAWFGTLVCKASFSNMLTADMTIHDVGYTEHTKSPKGGGFKPWIFSLVRQTLYHCAIKALVVLMGPHK